MLYQPALLCAAFNNFEFSKHLKHKKFKPIKKTPKWTTAPSRPVGRLRNSSTKMSTSIKTASTLIQANESPRKRIETTIKSTWEEKWLETRSLTNATWMNTNGAWKAVAFSFLILVLRHSGNTLKTIWGRRVMSSGLTSFRMIRVSQKDVGSLNSKISKTVREPYSY